MTPGPGAYRITHHARRRMEQRGIEAGGHHQAQLQREDALGQQLL